MTEINDLIVIGAGPGGYAAAVHAAQHKLKVILFEKEKIGGVCLNNGCIPTKSLLKAGEIFYNLQKISNWGIKIGGYNVDIIKMIDQSRQIVKELQDGLHFLLKKNNVQLIQGYARISEIQNDVFTINCEGEIFLAKNIILATGSTFKELPESVLKIDQNKRIWRVKEAMRPNFIPKKLAIIGAGAIGMEFANFYCNIGSNVHIFEMSDRILPGIDLEIAMLLQKQLIKQGIAFNLGVKIEKITEFEDFIAIKTNNLEENFDVIIVAIGVNPNIADFKNLVETENNYIKTNSYHQTSRNGLFAIGDCAAPPWLAHKATHEGIRAVKMILGEKIKSMSDVPMCIYTTPQIACIGKSFDELKTEYEDNFDNEILIKYSYFYANGKAVANHEDIGFVKIFISKKTSQLLGVHMIGPEVTELIHSCALAMRLEALPEDWQQTIFPHPTLSEVLWEAF